LLDEVDTSAHFTNRIIITGGKNFIWLGVIIVSVFLDPNIIEGFPYIEIHGKKVSFIREIIQLSVAFLAYRYANKKALTINKFNFEPIFEVGFLFFGIFMSMIPALQLLESLGKESNGLSVHLIYWSTGIFSSVLDNAPTYINFLALSLTTQNLSLSSISDVVQFATSENAIILVAISTASVFFGALTYIGNGPNFMVKAIAEQTGIKMPGFFQYMYKYSLIILLPILFIIWVLFFLI
jgi:Na+/H+ antiporter NhaD/arsenite permease-like protein